MAKKTYTKTQIADLKKHIKAYLELADKRAAIEEEETALAEAINGICGSEQIALSSLGVKVQAIKKRTSEKGAEPVEYGYYFKVLGNKEVALSF